MPPLPDQRARERALNEHDTTLLVEAGAGTGKTSLMAGRVVKLLADGVAPRDIAAITFTDLAAAELNQRITEYVEQLLRGEIDDALAAAFPDGLPDDQLDRLQAAHAHLDEIVCTTIHGFCQALIRPYPIEAGIDPGAKIMDPAEADLAFGDIFDRWLRERFSGDPAPDDVLVEALHAWQAGAVDRIREMARIRRDRRSATTLPVTVAPADFDGLRQAVADFRAWYAAQGVEEPDTARVIADFEAAMGTVDTALADQPEARLDAAGLLRLADAPRVPAAQHKNKHTFGAFRTKTKWQGAAKQAGQSAAQGTQLYDAANTHFEACRDTYLEVFARVAGALLHRFHGEFDELLARFADHKRAAALLDFDDLVYTARDVLKRDPDIRQALTGRFAHILVDEFQDTDPLQCEILWWLAGEPPADAPQAHWARRRLAPGKLFLVGDPKQSIYRFRGADVSAYLTARNAIAEQTPDNILAITANFRSVSPLLDWVNARFHSPISDQGLAFDALEGTQEPADPRPAVSALDVTVETLNDKPTSDDMRDSEARAVAELVQLLIHDAPVRTRDGTRRCRPGDIALLAPSGSSLWVYERFLEERGIPIATQAGKGYFQRQEVLDLIAIARVLADPRDTLALGALLRGPLVGLGEQELLDVAAGLDRGDKPDRIPRLTVWTDPAQVANDLCKRTLETLQALAKRARRTTPFELMADAIEELRVRPLLEQRHRGDAERALANVDLFLELAKPFAVRGMRAFARDMREKWESDARRVEGRPDAEAEAVQLITMHAAKGLEWPYVIPINAMTGFKTQNVPLVRREDDTLHMDLAAVPTPDRQALVDQDKTETKQERQRLWYVATTRARDHLVLPRLSDLPKTCWQTMVDLDLGALPAFEPTGLTAGMGPGPSVERNDQTRQSFVEEARRIVAAQPRLVWRQPSRHEPLADGAPAAPAPTIRADDEPDATTGPSVLGGNRRGLVMHKLIEEYLTGETPEADGQARAAELLGQLGLPDSDDPGAGFSSREIAASACAALALPEISALRDQLIPEATVLSTATEGGEEIATSGTADALALEADGGVDCVVDWKSDVAPAPGQQARYREQVADYMRAVGAKRGLVVYATLGTVDEVA